MQRKPTMSDVAVEAGVGTMTVSRVLNGSPHVSAATAQRVRDAILKLHYHPNEMARALRNSKSRTIGLLVPNLYDSFYASCAHGINIVARRHGYTVLLTLTHDDAAQELHEARKMLQRHVEGLIVIPAANLAPALEDHEFSGIPIVSLDRPMSSADGPFDTVMTDNEVGMWRATQHLIVEHGLKRILFVGYTPELYTVSSRFAGYERAMREARLTPRSDFSCSSNHTAALLLGKVLRKPNPPQAIVSANNLVTRQLLWAISRQQIAVPSQLAMVCFDDLELGDLLHPALTVVRQPSGELGEKAADLLFTRVNKSAENVSSREVVMPAELILRHSCGCKYSYNPGLST